MIVATIDNRKIQVFESQQDLEEAAREVAPAEVLHSLHPSTKKANAFAKKIHKLTPWMDLVLCKSTI